MEKIENITCPVCKVKINWTATNKPKVFQGVCPKCKMTFTSMNGTIVGGVKFSKGVHPSKK